ncbi:MAG: type II secretion system protein J [Candidatus Babeliales bacterium]
MKSPGFMLLELLVSMLISSMLAIALFAAFGQTNRAVQTIDRMVDVSYKETVAIHQLTKDISGAFIPTQGRKKKSSAGTKEDEKVKKEAQSKLPEAKKEKKRLTKIFYGTTKDEQLNVLTCITNNSTLEYPLGVVRVAYRLVPESPFNPKKPSYVLMRQESGSKLDFNDFNSEQKEGGVRAYALIGNVKKLSVAYTAAINKELKEKKEQPTSAKANTAEGASIEREYKVLNEWVMEEEQEKQYKEYTKIPYAVDIDCVLWDDRKEREHKVSFKIMVLNEAVEYEQEKQQTSITPQQPQQTQQPGAPGTQGGGKRQTTYNARGSALDRTPSAIRTYVGNIRGGTS